MAVRGPVREKQERLEQAWREAEEIAAISDDLLLPEGNLDDLNPRGGGHPRRQAARPASRSPYLGRELRSEQRASGGQYAFTGLPAGT